MRYCVDFELQSYEEVIKKEAYGRLKIKKRVIQKGISRAQRIMLRDKSYGISGFFEYDGAMHFLRENILYAGLDYYFPRFGSCHTNIVAWL